MNRPPEKFFPVTPNLAYVVQSTDEDRLVKVGFSKDPVQRFIGIRASVPFGTRLVAMMYDGHKAERHMKALLHPMRVRGEWFKPGSELDEFLAEQRDQQRLCQKLKVDQEFADRYITPPILEYLGDRAPALNEPGDLVYRYLREGIAATRGRIAALIPAVKGAVSAELLFGFVPLSVDAPRPTVMRQPADTEAA